METKLLAPIHSVNCSHGNSIFCFPKITKVFHLWHFPILFCSILQEVNFCRSRVWHELEASGILTLWSCHLQCRFYISRWQQLEPRWQLFDRPLIRFSRHSTSGNSLTFCPPQRLGEETSRFFGINFNFFSHLIYKLSFPRKVGCLFINLFTTVKMRLNTEKEIHAQLMSEKIMHN